jgi:hypothetical protein
MRERIIQAIQEAKEKVWTDYQEDNFGYPEWFDHLDSVDSVDDIIRAISKLANKRNRTLYITRRTKEKNTS